MKVGDSFFDFVMIITSNINNSVLLIAIYVFIKEYEVRRIGLDRKNKVNEWSFGK